MSTRQTTFTLRDLNRTPAKVLKACDHYGQITIRTRAGKSYLIQVEKPKSTKKHRSVSQIFKEHRERLRKLGYVPPPPSEMDRINKIIAGEI